VQAHGLVVFDLVAPSYPAQIVANLGAELVGNDDVDASSDGLLRAESEKILRGMIPARDDTVEGLGHDRIVGRFHSRDEQLLALGELSEHLLLLPRQFSPQRRLFNGGLDDALDPLEVEVRFGDVIRGPTLHGLGRDGFVALAGRHHDGHERKPFV
jgi:hypothetical protein